MKLCLACSAGGHLSELRQLMPAFSEHEHFFLTDERIDSRELSLDEKTFFVECPRRNPVKFVKNFFQSLAVMLREKPDVVVSTGADTAFAACFLAKIFGKKLVFVESFARIHEPSLSGKLLYPIADLFLVQWRENLSFYPKAKYWGAVF